MKKALRINALFSGISGSVLILFQSRIAHLFEIERSTVFWIIGVALIFFASTIFYEIERQNKFRIIWIIVQDMLWVIGSIYLLAANPFPISAIGHYIIAVIAAVVFVMAINQSVALIKGRK